MSSFLMLFLKETVLFPLYIVGFLVEDQWTAYVWVYFQALYSVPLVYSSVFIPVPYCFDYCRIFWNQEVWCLQLWVFPQDLFSIQIFCGTIWILGFFFLFPLLKSHWSYFQIAQNNGSTQLLFCPVSQQTCCEHLLWAGHGGGEDTMASAGCFQAQIYRAWFFQEFSLVF